MQAEQNISQGHLTEALAQLQNSVRKDPSNAKLRVFLFQLLAVLGQRERALTQLSVAGELDAANLLMVQTYREAIQCEALRLDVFAGRRTPMIFGDPQHWVALLVEALHLDSLDHHQEAKSLRDQSLQIAPTVSGTLNGTEFDWIADADSRLGPVLEAIVNGRYYWIPFQQIGKIEIEEPKDLRDVVWMPAVFTWANGGGSSGLIPTRYPGTENSEDSSIRLSRKTDWVELFDGTYKGMGQRILTTDADEYALMDIRHIELNVTE